MDTQNTELPRRAIRADEHARPTRRPLALRVLKWIGVALLALVLLLVIALVFLLRTDAGRGIIDGIARPIIEEQVAAQLGSGIDYAGIEGALPGELILRDVALSAEGEDWLTVDRVALDWSPLALLSSRVEVDSLVVTGADLLRMPPARPEQPEQPPQEGGGLPDIVVRRVAIEPLTLYEPVLGERYVVTAEAAAAVTDGDIDASLSARTRDDRDVIRAEIAYDPERLVADLTVVSAPDGLIATLGGTDGRVRVSLDGDGPLSAWSGTLDAEIGAYGAAQAQVGGDLASFEGARFDGTLRPGPGLPDIAGQVAGESLALTVNTRRDGEAILIDLTRAEGRFGDLSGTVRLASPAAEAVEADLSGTLSRPLATEFGVADLAGPVSLDAQARKDGEAWTFGGTVATPTLRANVEDGRSAPDLPFSGRVVARADGFALGNDRIDPLLARGLTASGDVRLADERATVSDLSIASGEGANALRVTGEAAVVTETTTFDAALDVQAARGVLADLLGTGEYRGPLNASLAASGTPDAAAVTIDADLPAGSIEGQPFGQGRLVADLSGLPGAPSGDATLTSADDSYRGRLVARSEGETIIVPELRFAAAGLALEAEGRGNPAARTVDATLTLDAGTSTTLVTGQTVGGTLNADVEIGEDGGPVAITANARSLRFDDITVGGAQVEAQGPLDAIRYGVSIDDAALPQVFLALLNTSGVADLSTPQRRVTIAELRAAVNEDAADNTITLLAPATVEFGEVIALSEVRFDWLDDATLTAEGRYAPELWVAEVTGRGVSVPGIEASADIDLSVDTREPTPATARVVATATPADRGTFTLTLDGRWTGERVTADAAFAEAGSDALATAEVGFPVILTRTGDALGVELPEEGLSGRVRYDDRIAPLYAFVPVEEEYLTGRLDADIALGGALTAPEARGRVTLSDGRFEESTVGLVLTELQGTADLDYTGTATSVTVALSGAGADGRDRSVRLNGDVRLAEVSSVDVALVLDEAQLADSAELELRTTGELGLTGSLDALTLAGEVVIAELDAQIPSLEGGDDAPEYVPVTVVRVDGRSADLAGETAKDEDAEPPLIVALDLRIRGDDAIFVRGRGLTSEWRTGLTITGTTAQPIIGGDVSLLEGTFDFAGRVFDLTEGRIEFDRQRTIDPRLDIEAAYDTGDVTAIIAVTGPASDPELALRSEPPRPDEDIMALILFGKNPTDLTALESLQIANAVAQLTGASPFGGGPGITDKLRSSLGLDALSIGVGDDGAAALGIGKYVTEDVYVEARQSAGETGTEVVVTYEATDNVTLESALRPSGSQSVSANYKKDY